MKLLLLALLLLLAFATVRNYRIVGASGPEYIVKGGWLYPTPVVRTERASESAEGAREYRLTAYSCYDAACLTSSGEKAGPGTVAHEWLPFGTRLEIEGLDVFTVRDRGTITGDWLDVWQPTRAAEIEFGNQFRVVTITVGEKEEKN
ncbi:MAG: hypothetical protein Q7O66_16545 [Dehalococcoidia bacterium]|nr:hypothetical protein [Dehalococcoidia bacterium]